MVTEEEDDESLDKADTHYLPMSPFEQAPN